MNFKGAGACRDYRREQEDPSGTWRASFVSRTHIFEDKWGISRSLKCYGVGFSRLSWELGILPKHIGTFSMTKGSLLLEEKEKLTRGHMFPLCTLPPRTPFQEQRLHHVTRLPVQPTLTTGAGPGLCPVPLAPQPRPQRQRKGEGMGQHRGSSQAFIQLLTESIQPHYEVRPIVTHVL